ncbi:MAG: sigma-70 family RNA polymerase sigma factor [Acidobacteria bacterium]|nr:sigma-70 family RNA polymerase sigma factor [Acidobacteriota bacterium]
MGLLRRNRKREEFEAQAVPHLDSLYRTARRALGDPSRADDVVQDLYLRAWRSFDTFEPGTNCRAWLFKILLHCIHDHRRRWLSRPPADDSDEILGRQTAPEPVPAAVTDEELLQALDRLPEQSREILLLADVEGFAYKEIASLLQIRIGTVMSRLSRARGKLRESLNGSALLRDWGPARVGSASA